jgi:hypothetical protein
MKDTLSDSSYATQDQLNSTFDSTCRFWVRLSGPEFLSRLDEGVIDTTDERVQKVIRRLDYVRPRSRTKPLLIS